MNLSVNQNVPSYRSTEQQTNVIKRNPLYNDYLHFCEKNNSNIKNKNTVQKKLTFPSKSIPFSLKNKKTSGTGNDTITLSLPSNSGSSSVLYGVSATTVHNTHSGLPAYCNITFTQSGSNWLLPEPRTFTIPSTGGTVMSVFDASGEFEEYERTEDVESDLMSGASGTVITYIVGSAKDIIGRTVYVSYRLKSDIHTTTNVEFNITPLVPYLNIDKTTYIANSNGGNVRVNVSANCLWKVYVDGSSDGISINTTGGNVRGNGYFDISINPTSSISANDKVWTICVKSDDAYVRLQMGEDIERIFTLYQHQITPFIDIREEHPPNIL